MGFYRADARWSFAGQLMQNTLYYRDRDPFTGDLVVQSELLAEKLTEHFFPEIDAQWLSLIPEEAHMDEWAIMPLDNTTFGPALSTPVIVPIVRFGYGPADVAPPGCCVIMRFVLRVAPITSGFYQPRRSHLAIGPVPNVHIDEVGKLMSNAVDSYLALGAIFAGNVGTVLGAGGWAPVRFGQGPEPLSLRGFAEVDGCSPKSTLSYRKSRQPE